MTILQLTDGKELRVSQSYEEIRNLLQEAMNKGGWLELHGENGLVTGINPSNVSYIQNDVGEGPGPAAGEDWHAQELRSEGTPA
jgi:hypothetical protein